MLDIKQPSDCKYSSKQVARLIKDYCREFSDNNNPYRTANLAMLEDIARDNNVILPTPKQIAAEKPSKRFVCDFVHPDEFSSPVEMMCRYDGERVVAYVPSLKTSDRQKYPRTKWDDLFDTLYPYLKSSPEFDETGKSWEQKQVIRNTIRTQLIRQFINIYGYDDSKECEPCFLFISRKISNYFCAFNNRRQRFNNKFNQVKWSYWVTFTYDDDKCTEQEFAFKLLKKLQNYVTKRGWRYIGTFERGDVNDRLHFHCFLYIPEGKMVGELVERDGHSWKRRAVHEKYFANTEFEDKFGRNSFECLDGIHNLKPIADYLQKMQRYIDNGCRLIYSRHISTEFRITLRSTDLISKYVFKKKQFVTKYVVKDSSVLRSDLSISRVHPILDISYKHDPYENGLL